MCVCAQCVYVCNMFMCVMCGCIQCLYVCNLCMWATYEYVDNTTTIDSPPKIENKIEFECEFFKNNFKTESKMGYQYHHMNMTDFCKSCKFFFCRNVVWRFHKIHELLQENLLFRLCLVVNMFVCLFVFIV